jgi:glycosyltransferase involved in cell wall biosynthesis
MDSVLVVIVFTTHKQYCRFLYPKNYSCLTWENKTCLYVTEKECPELGRQATGEQRAACGRQFGIDYARKHDFDWIFFLDADTEPDPDAIEKMLSVKHALVGGLHAARGDPWHCIGHNYKDRKSLERIWLRRGSLEHNPEVDGISGGTLLVARGVYHRVDYSGYIGPGTIPNRYTADDEYLEIKIYNSLKLKPKVASECRSWHYSDDGRAYRLWGEVKQWREF